MANKKDGKGARSASYNAAQNAFNALTTDEKLAFMMENMLSAAVGGVQKASDVFAEAMEEAIRTARRACDDDAPENAHDEATDFAPDDASEDGPDDEPWSEDEKGA